MRQAELSMLAVIAAALIVASCTKGGAEGGAVQPDAGVGAEANWSAVGGSADEASYSRLEEIGTGNIRDLGLEWSRELPGEVTLEATPLAVGGVLYFSGSYAAVYAVDGKTGKRLWKYDPETWKNKPIAMHLSFGANRGVAYEKGRVFVGTLDGRLVALDARTGKELWAASTVPEGAFNIVTGAPRAMNGKVIIGNGGADFGARGFVTAYDAQTGKQLWRFYTVPGKPDDNKRNPAMEAAAKTWGLNFWKHTGGGGTVWNGITYDAETNRVYIGAGNTGPYDPEARDPGGGDNLYAVSIIALDADTGRYIWHYQENPRDSWDYKSTPNIVMATLRIGGKPRKVLLHAPTNGFFYVLDRDTGKLVNELGKTTVITWAKRIDITTGRPVEQPDIRYAKGRLEIWPGTVGGHNWQAMSYSPKTGLVYIPVQQIGAFFQRGSGADDDGFNVMGLVTGQVVKKPGDGKGSLVAWNPVTQKQAWRIQNANLWNGGTLATAGGLVFQGTAEGTFNAYDAASGKRLWRFDAGLGIISAPMSYAIGGKQYVSVLVGYGGTAGAYGKHMDVGWKYGAQPRRLLTFAIGGKARLAPSPPATFKVNALDDPGLAISEEDIAAGRALSVQCAACHGVGFHSTGSPAPDLRESGIALQLDSFTQLLRSGALMANGMPRFESLTDEQIRQLHAYIRARAREALGQRKASGEAGPTPKL